MPTEPAQHTCGYMGYVYHVGDSARSSKNHSDYLGLNMQILAAREVE